MLMSFLKDRRTAPPESAQAEEPPVTGGGVERSDIKFGYHASHEQFRPSELLDYVVAPKQAGFTAAISSDHFHPAAIPPACSTAMVKSAIQGPAA